MCDGHLVNNPTPLEAKDHFKIVVNSNDDYTSSDDDSLYNENIENVEASPHDSELVSLEVAEIVISEDEEIEDDNLREKLLNFPPTDRSDFTHEEFEIAHIISPPEYDCFYFRNLSDPGEWISILNSKIREKLSSTTRVNLPVEDDHSPFLAYVVWILLSYLMCPVIPPYLHSFGNEDTIFDPDIAINHFYSFKPGLSHRCGTFKKFNTHRSHLNESPIEMITRVVKSFMLLVFHSQELHILSFILGIHLLHLAGSQPILKSSYKTEAGVIISIPSLVGGVADVVVEIKGTGWSIPLLHCEHSPVGSQPDNLSRTRLGSIENMLVGGWSSLFPSAKDKSGLGYGSQIHDGVLSYENEVFTSIFDSRSSDVEDNSVNDRFVKVEGVHAVPPPMTGISMPPKSDFVTDESKFTYGPKQSTTSEFDAKTSDLDSCESSSSEETLENVPKLVESKPKIELNKQKGKITGPRENRSVWNNVQRLNHQNKFLPTAILTKTSRFPINAARHNFARQAASTSTARKVNTARPKVNEIRPRHNVYKSHSPIRRPFNRTTAQKPNFTQHKVNTDRDKTVSVVRGKWETVVKDSDNPHRKLKGKGIVDRGCSRHMTGNKAYLVDYQDFNGRPVAFGGSKGQIAGKVSIACYVLKRVLVTKPQNKTSYELLTGKFEEKCDEGFLVGYSLSSKAIRPITTEKKAYKTAGQKETNNSEGTQDSFDAGNSKMEVDHAQEYDVLPLWSSYTLIVKSSKENNVDEKLNEDTNSNINEEPVDQKDKAFLEELERLKRQEKAANCNTPKMGRSGIRCLGRVTS
uniref:Uncharacterized protein n=1 Tax=Tanacetum cinerariifolium TaxID=118510 RepID=A0A699GZG7_TANCI|nr:hypothetical protein [Tanacetum cinerariifolium]